DGCQHVEAARLIAPGDEFRMRQRDGKAGSPWVQLRYDHDAVLCRDDRLEEDRVGDGEYRSHRADAKAQGDDGENGDESAAAQTAAGIANIAQKMIHRSIVRGTCPYAPRARSSMKRAARAVQPV